MVEARCGACPGATKSNSLFFLFCMLNLLVFLALVGADASNHHAEGKLQCLVRILGDCAEYPHMSHADWFDDSMYGGRAAPPDTDCKQRNAS